MALRAQIIVKGIVQGVGFRPFVHNLARSLELKGYVANTSEGVLIEIEGENMRSFVRRLRTEAPPLSRIIDVYIADLPFYGYHDFTIRHSTDTGGKSPFTLVSPDVSICADCLREMLDLSDRRYLYPFINCTNCGPRYSITKSIPYDRPNTTMASFTMCPDCEREYHDQKNRRFHAQPNACGDCGPQVEFKVQSSEFGIKSGKAMEKAINLLKNGGIVAIKGLGGFHIACDATNDNAVKKLREKKRKSNKPFAVMAPDIENIRRFCHVSDDERKALQSNKRPIVLLCRLDGHVLSGAVSPNNMYIGCMLPYTPLHYLLFHHPIESRGDSVASHFRAIVMTSGNFSEEPIVRDNEEAFKKLGGMVDAFLVHNRDIFMRVDDSVVRVRNADHSELRAPNHELSFLRRSRGYAPDPIALHDDGPEVLGCGADLKNTFTLTRGSFAIPSQHIGDMENYETLKFFEESLENLKRVYRVDPVAIVHDMHPGYLSTKWAMNQKSEVRGRESERVVKNYNSAPPLYALQHHYAHIGSVMAENGLKNKVIGVAFDGTGYGIDGNLWGGEFLIAGIDGFERVGQLKYMPLPGGEAAIREPWRTAVSYIIESAGDNGFAYLEQLGFVQKYGKEHIHQVMTIARSKELSPLSSGAGRLFDSVSAMLGICDVNTFEGEAAMALESLTKDGINAEYPVEFNTENGYTVVDFSSAITEIVNDMSVGWDKKIISTKFHNAVASVIHSLVIALSRRRGIMDVALSGGTFQNLYLLTRVVNLLKTVGMNVFINRKVPCNDAGISLGQAYIVRERLKK